MCGGHEQGWVYGENDITLILLMVASRSRPADSSKQTSDIHGTRNIF